MTISMYKASVPVFVQFLTSLSAVLDKAAAFAEAKKIEPSVLLNTRLAPDMFPLLRQVRAATDHAINAGGRLSGADMPSFSNTEATIPELKERIAKAVDFLESLEPARIDGTEDKAIEVTFPSAPIAGPPVHWPTASAWLTIESAVALTVESSTLRLSHAAKRGAATWRATKMPYDPSTASQRLPASAKTNELSASDA